MTSRTIYYYQTFIGLDKLLTHMSDIDVVILASIHFGTNTDNSPYIHLNNKSPNDVGFNKVWEQSEILSKNSTDILLLIGGAGGAFTDLFNSYTVYYKLLQELLQEKKFIKGVELDIEESVKLEDVKMLLVDLNKDFGDDFIITMAPVAYSMTSDAVGMGNFIYKDLYSSLEGRHINWFNVQSYGEFSENIYKSIVDNGYPPEKIVLGMLASEFGENNFNSVLETIKNIKIRYPDMAGIDVWEYFESPPDKNDPSMWAKLVKEIITTHRVRKWFKLSWLFN